MIHRLTPQFILEHVQAGENHGRFTAVVLFMDTFGFSRLTAALMTHGKVGAEILSDLLTAVFAPLIEYVYQHGGYIAGFAGDAFKAIFPAELPDCWLHAWAAAAKIRQHLATQAVYTTPVGDFEFAVRVSLAAGDVDWAVWAGEDKDTAQSHACSFYGEALDQAVLGESFAKQGEIVATTAVFERLRTDTTGQIVATSLDAEAEGFVCLEKSEAVLPSPLRGAEPPTANVPIASRFFPRHLLNSPLRGEFRPVYSVFITVETVPPLETANSFMPAFFRLLSQYDGYLCRMGRFGANTPGISLLLFWGAPTSHENDGERVLQFLLDLRAATKLRWRAGVSWQTVFAGFVGSRWQEEYTCYGMSVILASRQMSAAAWGDIWLDRETAVRASTDFYATSLGHLPFKGFAEPQEVFSLNGRCQTVEVGHFQTKLVGREAALEQLKTAVAPIFAGKFGGLVLVTGEAGIGKSHLVYELKRQLIIDDKAAGSFVWLHCAADEILRQSLNPFRTFLYTYFLQSPEQAEATNKQHFVARYERLVAQTPQAALRQELERTRSFLAALVNLHFSDSLYEQLDSKLRFDNTLTALKTFFLAIATAQPLILEIEDVHWLDADSLRFVQLLMQLVAFTPLLVVATSRPQIPSELEPAKVVTLTKLSQNNLVELTRSHLDLPPNKQLLELLQERSGGNPFFAEQILLYLQENQFLAADGEEWGLVNQDLTAVLPVDVQAVLISRLDRLTQAVKEVVQMAAVIGREFEVQILSRILQGKEELPQLVETAVQQAIWTELDQLRYLFRHALLRDAAYEMQLRSRLRTLHQTVAEAIEQLHASHLERYYPDLVYHFRHAYMPAQELAYAQKAAEKAIDDFANADATTYLNRVLVLLPDEAVTLRFQTLMQRATVYDVMGEMVAVTADLSALERLIEAMPEAERTGRLIEVILKRAIHAHVQGQAEVALREAETAVALADRMDSPSWQSQAHYQLARVQTGQGDYEAARASYLRALSLVQEIGDDILEAHVINGLGIIGQETGNYAEAEKHLNDALARFEALGKQTDVAHVLNNIAAVQNDQNKLDAGLATIERCSRLHQKIGNKRGYGIALLTWANLCVDLGRFSQGAALYKEGAALYRETGNRNNVAIANLNLAVLYIQLGLRQQAAALLAEGLTLTQETKAKYIQTGCLMALGYLAVLEQELATAQAYLDEGLMWAEEIGVDSLKASFLTYHGHLKRAEGDMAAAVDYYQRGETLFNELGQPHKAFEAGAVLAEVDWENGRFDTAYQRAQEIYTYLQTNILSDLYDPFAIYWVCHQILEAAKDERAIPFLRKTVAMLQQQANNIDDATMRDSFLSNWASHRRLLAAA